MVTVITIQISTIIHPESAPALQTTGFMKFLLPFTRQIAINIKKTAFSLLLSLTAAFFSWQNSLGSWGFKLTKQAGLAEYRLPVGLIVSPPLSHFSKEGLSAWQQEK
jgi:hypothetical protein